MYLPGFWVEREGRQVSLVFWALWELYLENDKQKKLGWDYCIIGVHNQNIQRHFVHWLFVLYREKV